jgi:hypothetical protein
MGIVVISFSLVAAIFVSVMVEMYVGLLADMIMLGLSSARFSSGGRRFEHCGTERLTGSVSGE